MFGRKAAMSWHAFDNGKTIGQRGSENGVIVRDEEHRDGARITLERHGNTPNAITCGIYGWMVHTCFFTTESDTQNEFDRMKEILAQILDHIPLQNDPEFYVKSHTVSQLISDFVVRFP